MVFNYHNPEYCEELTNPENGEVKTDGLKNGSTASYDCDEGFRLIGNVTRTCKNETWSGRDPICGGICILCISLVINKYGIIIGMTMVYVEIMAVQFGLCYFLGHTIF